MIVSKPSNERFNINPGNGTPNRGRLLPLGIVVATLYVVAAWWESTWLQLLYGDAPSNQTYVEEHGLAFLARHAVIYLPAATTLVGAMWLGLADGVKDGLSRWGGREFTVALFSAAAAGVVLDGVLLWPWAWRYTTDASLALGRALTEGRQWPALLLWLVIWGVLIPALEEVVFRGMLLRWLRARCKVDVVAVLASALAFGILHIGPSTHPTEPAIRNACFAMLFGIVAGIAVIRRGGRTDVAIGLHVGHTLAGMFDLLVASRTYQ